MASRNVELLIQARENASRVIKTVNSELEKMETSQAALESRNDGFSKGLAESTAKGRKFAAALAGDVNPELKDARDAFARIEATLKGSRAEFEKHEASLAGSREEYAALKAQIEAARGAIKRAETAIGPQTEEQTERLRLMRLEYRNLQKQAGRTAATIEKQEKANRKNEQSLIALSAAANKAGRNLKSIETISRSQNPARGFLGQDNPVSRFADAVARAVREVTGLPGPTERATTATSRFALETGRARGVLGLFAADKRRSLSLAQRLRGELLALTASVVGFYAAFELGGGILTAYQTIEAAQNRLGAAFEQDTNLVADQMDMLNDMATRLGFSFGTLSDNYSKFIISGQQAGLSVEELDTIFRQVVESGRVLKLSNEQIDGTLTALVQIAGKGTVQMEELRQQLGDRIPGAVGLMASALGYGENELADFYKAVEQGNINARDGLVAFGQGLEDTYGGQLEEALESTSAKIGEFQNLIFQRKVTAAEGGFIDGLNAALESLNAWLESEEGIRFFEDLGATMGTMLEIAAQIPEHFDEIITVAKILVSLKIAATVLGWATALSEIPVAARLAAASVALFGTSTLTMSSALTASRAGLLAFAGGLTTVSGVARSLGGVMRVLLAIFGGVPGLLAAAAGAVAYFAFDVLFGADEVARDFNRTMQETDQIVRGVARAFRESGGDIDAFKEKLGEIGETEIRLNIARVEEELAKLRDGNRAFFTGVRKDVSDLRTKIAKEIDSKALRSTLFELLKDFNQNIISASQLRKEVLSLGEQYDELGNFAPLLDFFESEDIDRMIEFETQLERLHAVLALTSGTATDAQKELLGVADVAEDAGESAEEAARKAAAFDAALNKLAAHIPSFNAALKEADALKQIEKDFEAALKAADAFGEGLERNKARAEAFKVRDQATNAFYADQVSGFNGTDAIEVAAAFLRSLEGFRSTPYNDPRTDRHGRQVGPDIYRAGYGSDTVTLSDGSIKKITQGMQVSVGDANRDLRRRLATEFMPIARDATGAARFDSFNPQQKAVLASIAYNYGEIPGRIVEAVRTGTGEEIAAAIRSLAGDNGGVNAGRRRKEAALFTSPTGEENLVREQVSEDEKRAEEETRRLEKQSDFLEAFQARLDALQQEAELENASLTRRKVAEEIAKQEKEAREAGLELTQAQRAEIEKTVTAANAVKQAEEDRNKALEQAREVEGQLTNLAERRRMLIEQITEMHNNGEMVAAAGLTEQLNSVEAEMETVIAKAREMWAAIGGQDSETALLGLDRLEKEVSDVGTKAVVSGRQLNDMFADRLVGAVETFTQKIAAGEKPIQALGQAFSQMAAEILLDLGRMILRQAFFNAISGLFGGGIGGGGGLGGLVAGGVNSIFRHNGGVAGTGTGISGRKFDPAVFANAARYHDGGIAGLAPNEVPAVLEKDEEVLTRDDPRHVMNGGRAGPGEEKFTLINALDPESVLTAALEGAAAGKVLLNWMSESPDEIKRALELDR